MEEILFGIARNPIGTRASQWAQQTEFLTFPEEKYNR